MTIQETVYIVVIDTNRYAGNFEREMCAFCTGLTGDCGVGVDEKKEFEEAYNDYMFDDMGVWRDKEGNCRRPVELVEKDSVYNSVGILFNSIPNKEQLDIIEKRAREYAKRINLEILGIRVLKEETGVTEIIVDTK